jgi:hypothetical protein
MAYFEFEYFGDAHAPIVADMYANSECRFHRTRVGQIDQPDGVKYRANLYLPGSEIHSYKTLEDASREMLKEAGRWLRRMGLEQSA